jgi:hypothetical protein
MVDRFEGLAQVVGNGSVVVWGAGLDLNAAVAAGAVLHELAEGSAGLVLDPVMRY